jgi:signal transduction histidine kinase
MRIPRQRPGFWSRLRLPRRTARLRLTLLYSGVFLVCAVALLGLTYLLVARQVPHVPGADSTRPPPHAGSKSPGTRAAGSPSTAAKEAAKQQAAADLRQLQIQSGVSLGVATIVALTLGWLAAGRILRPLSTITTTARRISATSLSERLNLPGPDDELKELGDTLDSLFTRLEASFDAQRHFVANASHELRTPLTANRALLQVALDEPDATADMWRAACEELLASNTEQERLIEALLMLATSEAGLHRREPVDLCAVTQTVLLTPRPETHRLGLRVEADTTPTVLHGDPVLAQRLVANLFDNAVRHNIPGGCVQVATRAVSGRAIVSVVNTGPVIPPDKVDRLFQPFQRLQPRRGCNGHGLGLSIVQAIATAHGATITARALPGGGLAIDVAFPPPGRIPGQNERQGIPSGV